MSLDSGRGIIRRSQILRPATSRVALNKPRCLWPRGWNLGYLKILRTTRRISFSTLYIRKYVENGRSLVSSGWEKGGGSLFLSKRTSVLYAGRARVKNWKDHQQREWERRREGDFHRNLFIEFESFPRRLLDRLPSALNEEEDQRGDEKVWEAKQVRDGIKCIARICLLIRIFHEYLEEPKKCSSLKSLLILSRKNQVE